MKLNLILIFVLLVSLTGLSQEITQTVRGSVIDKQSQFPIPGAKIIVANTDPVLGAMSDFDGNFEIKNVPVGRITLQISFVGYEPLTLSNLELKSGKELIVNAGMEESIAVLEKVEVVYKEDKGETINKMSTVSARTISVEEAGKFAGSLSDPARMAQNYAGVSGVSDDRNDIIIRGNSPLGVLWRMEGIDIPSPNHFATLGTTGGPVSMLNINNLSNSDFYTSAWTADYGNALSGVFDLRLRNGNNSKNEFLGQVGFNGFEFGAEGPFSSKHRGSYLVNYRYSTLGVISALGVDLGVGTAIPQYQDLTFKMNFPTKKAGRFTVWGVGGTSFIEFEPSGDLDSTNLFSGDNEQSKFTSNTAVVGASHKYFFNKNTFYELILASSVSNTLGEIDTLSEGGDAFNTVGFNRLQMKNSLNLKLNHKINAKNTIAAGIIGDNFITDILDSAYVGGAYRTISDNRGSAFLLQSYINYQHRFNDKWTFNGGVHSQHFWLSESNIVEPRLGFKFQPNKRHTLSLGSGLHSQIQPITVYFIEEELEGEITYPNQNLDFTKSIHNVLGYDFRIGPSMRLKAEAYYQYLYDIPVDSFPSTFSMLNQGADFLLPNGTGYLNEGTGRNYGVELTLEKFLDKGYYFLFTTSLFDSKYKGSDGIERNTAFNGNYIFNFLAGYEFNLNQNFTIGFDWKITYAGGRRFTPIDLASSQLFGTQIEFTDQAFEEQQPDYFRTDFKTTLKLNGKRVNQEFSVDLQNFTNQQNIFQYGYNNTTGQIEEVYQRGFFPNIQYRINF
ncbi:MAG: TonB-dependent receptor [Crocinitomicaceae bacterium]|nr:TonB-dependent receptor [Crocinitomicaceae bacterium]